MHSIKKTPLYWFFSVHKQSSLGDPGWCYWPNMVMTGHSCCCNVNNSVDLSFETGVGVWQHHQALLIVTLNLWVMWMMLDLHFGGFSLKKDFFPSVCFSFHIFYFFYFCFVNEQQDYFGVPLTHPRGEGQISGGAFVLKELLGSKKSPPPQTPTSSWGIICWDEALVHINMG